MSKDTDIADIDWAKRREELHRSPRYMAMMHAGVSEVVDMIGAFISGDKGKIERLRQQEEQRRAVRQEQLRAADGTGDPT